MMKYWVSVFP